MSCFTTAAKVLATKRQKIVISLSYWNTISPVSNAYNLPKYFSTTPVVYKVKLEVFVCAEGHINITYFSLSGSETHRTENREISNGGNNNGDLPRTVLPTLSWFDCRPPNPDRTNGRQIFFHWSNVHIYIYILWCIPRFKLSLRLWWFMYF